MHPPDFEKFNFHAGYLVKNGPNEPLTLTWYMTRIKNLVVSGVHIWARLGREVGHDSACENYVMRDAANPMKQCHRAHICKRARFKVGQWKKC